MTDNGRWFVVAAVVCLWGVEVGAAGDAKQTAREILDAAGFQGGLVVHVGCGRGEITAALHGASGCLVEGLGTSAENVAAAREAIQAKGLYGKVTIRRFGGTALPYTDDLVNLVVVTDPNCRVPKSEILRVLAPRGLAVVHGEKIVKPWPDEIDEWTHWLHGPDNNAVSKDRKVGVSRSLQWAMPPRWARHHNLLPSVSAMVSAGGRVYTIIDEGAASVKGLPDRWHLTARDGFNGLLLWKQPMGTWGWRAWSKVEFSGLMRFKAPSQVYRRIVAAGDLVYVTMGFDQPIVCLDGATGKTIRRYPGTENASEILHHQGLLAMARNVYGERPGKGLTVVEAETGKVLWQREAFRGTTARGDELARYTDAYLTAGGERLFLIDGDDVAGVELRTGKEAWRHPRPEMKKGVHGHYEFNHANLCTLVWHDGIVLLGQMYPFTDNLNKRQQKAMVLLAMDAATGRALWRREGMSLAHFTPPDVFVAGGLVWTMKIDAVSLLGLDLKTGEVRKEHPVRDMLIGHHHRCYRNKATENFYLAGEDGIEYIDFRTGALDVHHWVRGACRYGILPANGLVYLPTHPCGCHRNVKLNGFLALRTQRPAPTPQPPATRLETGPAFRSFRPATGSGQAVGNRDAWPVFRHDAGRSGCAHVTVPAAPSHRWSRPVGGDLTPPIVAGGNVYVACKQRFQLSCLDAETGAVRWQRTTEGRLDSPPTWHEGRLVFGTSSGHVVALDAGSGEMIWRFRAAPADVCLTAHGRLESPWPVHGSVTVLDGKVYAIAGRSMHLDSGLYAYLLDAATGKVIQHARLAADTETKGELEGAVLPDVLIAGADGVYMRTLRFARGRIAPHTFPKGGARRLVINDGGLLDDTWFNSTFWSYGGSKGQMLVFDANAVYGIRAYRKFVSKSYPHDIFTAGGGYRLFAARIGTGKGSAAGKSAKAAKRRRGKAEGTAAPGLWERKIAVRAQAMALAGDCLCLAGAPDGVDPKDPWAAFDGRKGGRLAVVSARDGKPLHACTLAAPPVHDGLAAAGGCLYLSLRDGAVTCYGPRR